MAAIDDLAKVARELVKVRESEPDRLRRRTEAIRAYADEHAETAQARLHAVIHDDLVKRGFTEEQIGLLGLSRGSVLKALEGRRWR